MLGFNLRKEEKYQMKKKLKSIYGLVDENYIKKFDDNHLFFMQKYYYSEYSNYCKKNNLVCLDESSFLSNMRRRSIKIIQLCCPYCGNIEIIIKKCCINEIEHYKYCPYCGKSSTSENSYFQLSRMVRIIHFHSAGLAMIKDKSESDKLELLTYDVYQLELVEISALFEVMLRDYFNAFLFIQYFG